MLSYRWRRPGEDRLSLSSNCLSGAPDGAVDAGISRLADYIAD